MKKLLLLDAGNTSVKYQSIDVSANDSLSSLIARTKDAPIQTISNEDFSAEKLSALWRKDAVLRDSVSVGLSWVSVGPKGIRDGIERTFRDCFGSDAPAPHVSEKTFTADALSCSLVNHYDEPQQLGADRWVASLGLLARFFTRAAIKPETPRIANHLLICAGSATTVNLLRLDAGLQMTFLGGWILPGVRLMHESLRQNTRDLNYALSHDPFGVAIPTDSQMAIAQGVALAQAGFVDELINAHAIEKIFLCGGDAAFWMKSFRGLGADESKLTLAPTLVFEGLVLASDTRKHI